MTLFDVQELHAYWQRHPPIHLMLAAFFGVAEREPLPMQPSSVPGPVLPNATVLANLPGMVAGAISDDLTPIFDVSELMRQRPN